MSIATDIERLFAVHNLTPQRARVIPVKTRQLALGAGPSRIRTNRNYGQTGRPMGLGQQGPHGSTPGYPGSYGCTTYANPELPPSDQNGCPGGWNGCGDTIGVSEVVAASATVDLQIEAAIEFTPRFFLYTGADSNFTIDAVFVANGPNSHFGPGYAAEVYAIDNFVGRAVSWPTFYNSPPLTIRVTELTAMQSTFSGVLLGVAAHQ